MEVSREPDSNTRLFPASGFRSTGKLVPGKLFNFIAKSLGSLSARSWIGKLSLCSLSPSVAGNRLPWEPAPRTEPLQQVLGTEGIYTVWIKTKFCSYAFYFFIFFNNEVLGFSTS